MDENRDKNTLLMSEFGLCDFITNSCRTVTLILARMILVMSKHEQKNEIFYFV